ncbi:hypothetical protein AYL99_05678 [Fonsecaea erecta]|uniref:Enoyl reductase (ER) domain-containing protein n=1 Tax=Fonsecaea erecta TaxID=1367422 RepID=A0A178ZMS6_9EURO|nr:hypothetical protein AYL99_05678 [Fonsecaea erecta]OAP60676.1 hypothetical protein AYL99_05678 [Fonsecaea erecta]
MGSMGGEDLPKTATAAVLTGAYGEPYTIKDVPIPVPAAQDALVELEYSGVCHGDVYARDGGGPAPKDPVRPLTGGHEGVGRIVAMGTDGLDGFKVGDTVGIAWRSYVCGTCQACQAGSENHCFNQKITGAHRDGTFQRYIAFPTSQLVPIPSGVSSLPSVCPILCAGVTAYAALQRMNPQAGKWCVVVGGAGGLGHLAIQYAKALGLKVLAIDGGSAEKEQFCTKMGADVFVDFTRPGLVETIVDKTGGGADYVLVLSPHQSSYDAAGEYASFGAQIMAIGIGNLHMSLRPLLRKDLLVRSNQTGTKTDMREALQIFAAGKVVPELEVVDLHDINEALDRIKQGKVMGKLVADLRGVVSGGGKER